VREYVRTLLTGMAPGQQKSRAQIVALPVDAPLPAEASGF
jgi:hypothetical protein